MGWYAPIELGNAQGAVGYAIPVDKEGSTFAAYVVEVGTHRQTKRTTWKRYRLVKVAKRDFILKLGPDEVRFSERPVYPSYRVLPYRGKLKHPDFSYGLIELQPHDSAQIDALFEKRRLFIIGCNPFFHYEDVESINQDVASARGNLQLKKRPVVIIIRDGWGHNPYPEWNKANAIHLAKTPVNDRLMREYPHVLIHTSGEDVGLPAGVMGNSEVGHQNIGAGRIVIQDVLRINRMIDSGEFFKNRTFLAAMKHVKARGSNLHLIGLASDALVHSSLHHLYGLLTLAKTTGIASERVFVHNFSDGRDSPPTSGIDFCRQIEAKIKEIGIGRIASVIGRYYAMDRDDRWERVEKAYRLLTKGKGYRVKSAIQAYQRYYDNPTEKNRTGDEFIEPTVITDANGEPLSQIFDGDAVIFYNYRGDRPRELCKAFCLMEFPFEGAGKDGVTRQMGFERERKLDVKFVTMTEYEQGLPVESAIPRPPKMPNILGAYASDIGLAQFRCAETEKFPHVTFFFNGYHDAPFDREDRQIILSPRDVSTYDQKPEMSAPEVTEEMLRRIASDKYDLIILNYANGDMVGHTGSLPAAIKAVETVDACVGKVVDAVMAKGGALIVTADHGNCEQMIHPDTGGPHTAHTTYDVDLIVIDDSFKGYELKTDGRLADIAPTTLELLGLDAPSEMTGQSLI
ncbi:2,3-bisphosphoglycerate-independent phosphoglycerate mutase [Candidatus Poribacteria bacterium]|nr:2,3-bisphosphoglycerate-independent phosphoglycerate mutase [Candidatus Poribacteria bacterium]